MSSQGAALTSSILAALSLQVFIKSVITVQYSQSIASLIISILLVQYYFSH